ncbi:hypothetical protein [Williamsia sterculiae]|nr:hypothetical protein [Williamsia sterculiae]
MTNSTTSSDLEQSYIAGEVAYMSGSGFHDEVSKRLPAGESADVTAVQNAQSSAITLTTTANSESNALTSAQVAIQTYTAHVQQLTEQRGRDAMAALDSEIATLQQQPGQSARIDQLTQQRIAIDVQTQRAPDVQLVQQPTATGSEAGNSGLTIIAGAVIGGILGLLISLAYRRRADVSGGKGVLVDEYGEVLSPIVDLHSVHADVDSAAGVGRELLAQLNGSGDRRIVVAGASTESGASLISALLSGAGEGGGRAARLVKPSESDHSPTPGSSGSLEIIDGTTIRQSPSLAGLISESDVVVVVVRLGYDSRTDIDVLMRLARRATKDAVIVCTRAPIWRSIGSFATPADVSPATAAVASPPGGGHHVQTSGRSRHEVQSQTKPSRVGASDGTDDYGDSGSREVLDKPGRQAR